MTLIPIFQQESEDYKQLMPTQSPIDPPYKTACYLKRNNLLKWQNDTTEDNCDDDTKDNQSDDNNAK